jgi:hypothetical protein
VRNTKLNMSLGLDIESSRGSLTKDLFLFEPRTSSMKLTKMLDDMVSSSINFVDLEPSLNGLRSTERQGDSNLQ